MHLHFKYKSFFRNTENRVSAMEDQSSGSNNYNGPGQSNPNNRPQQQQTNKPVQVKPASSNQEELPGQVTSKNSYSGRNRGDPAVLDLAPVDEPHLSHV